MTEEQARHLADTIIATWPSSAKHYIWKAVLLELDHHTADVTYRILRDGAQSAPTPGNYKLAYKNQHARVTAHPSELFDNPRGLGICRNEYIHRLEARAQHDPEAAEEYKRWTRRNHPTTRERT